MSDRPRTEAADLEEAEEARNLISTYWAEHYAHLSPEGNRLGGGAIDSEHGVVCNCGEVLGRPPAPQDPGEYLAQSDNVGDEATPEEAGWNDLMAAGDAGSPERPWSAAEEEYRVREGLPPWDTSDGPGSTKVETVGGGLANGDRRGPAAGEVITDDPVEEHAAQRETVVDLPPMPEDDRNDMYAVSPRGTLPARPVAAGVIPTDPLSARVVTIDPTKPYTPAEVELQLLEVENKLERGMHFQRYWEERSAAAALEWEIIYNRARVVVMKHGGSEKDRHAMCLQEPGVELALKEHELSKAMVRMARESMHTLRSLQSGYQTLCRSVENTYRGRQPGA